MSKPKRRVITVRLSPELHRQVRVVAACSMTSANAICLRAIREYCTHRNEAIQRADTAIKAFEELNDN